MNDREISTLTSELSAIIQKTLKEMHSNNIQLNVENLKKALMGRLDYIDLFEDKDISSAPAPDSFRNKLLEYISPIRGYIDSTKISSLEIKLHDSDLTADKLAAEFAEVFTEHITKLEHRLNIISDFIEDVFTRFNSLQSMIQENYGENIKYVETDLEQDKKLLNDAQELQKTIKEGDNIDDLQNMVVSSFDNFLGIFDNKIVDKKDRLDDMNNGYSDMEEELNSYKKEVDTLKSDIKKYRIESITDHLTGLFNRKYLDIKLEEEIERYTRVKLPFSVIMLDIDDFKKVNDEYGHLVGDQVLKHVAGICKKIVRKSDFVFRYGGEEFLILLINADIRNSMHIAEQIRKAIEKTNFTLKNLNFFKTASLGVAQYDDGDSQDSLISRADDALYKAKQTGKNKSIQAD